VVDDNDREFLFVLDAIVLDGEDDDDDDDDDEPKDEDADDTDGSISA